MTLEKRLNELFEEHALRATLTREPIDTMLLTTKVVLEALIADKEELERILSVRERARLLKAQVNDGFIHGSMVDFKLLDEANLLGKALNLIPDSLEAVRKLDEGRK